MAKSRAYEETLKELLVDPREAAEYLNAALEEGDPAAFLPALKDVANVHGSVGKLAELASLNRESMYACFRKTVTHASAASTRCCMRWA